jgi:hypothetical protein
LVWLYCVQCLGASAKEFVDFLKFSLMGLGVFTATAYIPGSAIQGNVLGQSEGARKNPPQSN